MGRPQAIYQVAPVGVSLEAGASASSWASSIQFWRHATSSGQAILSPWRGLHRRDELRCLQQALRRPGIKPGKAAAQGFEGELPLAHVMVVEVGDFEFTARRRRNVAAIWHTSAS